MKAIIGTTTTYRGDEFPGMKGQRVHIVAVMKNVARPDHTVDADDYLSTDDAIARRGEVTEQDRVDVRRVRSDGSVSFVHATPRATDLECFASLKG